MILPQELEFIRESNRIEGIKREPNEREIAEFERFLAQDEITIFQMMVFVNAYQPDAELRDKPGLDVYVGNHRPPRGDITIRTRLEDILKDANKYKGDYEMAYRIHQRYETLHPFTDCNGRSGRMLWLWQMQEAPLGFLHTWYYQSLSYNR